MVTLPIELNTSPCFSAAAPAPAGFCSAGVFEEPIFYKGVSQRQAKNNVTNGGQIITNMKLLQKHWAGVGVVGGMGHSRSNIIMD